MRRPGFLHGVSNHTPRGFGFFGKGFVAPPPGPPPGIPPGGAPPQFIEGKWQCSGTPPASEADGYYHCCPETGWTKTGYDVTRPCGENYGMIKCGPLPEGASIADAVCCENLKEWVPRDSSGADPCVQAALLQSQQTGQAVPGVTQTILTDEVLLEREPLVSPILLLGGGLVMALLFVVTIIFKVKN